MVPPKGAPRAGARGRPRGSARGSSSAATSRQRTADSNADEVTQTTEGGNDASARSAPSSRNASSAATGATLGSSASASPAPRTGTTTSAGKFKPKFVRRDEAERQSLAQQELRKQEQRDAEDARMKARLAKMRGRRGRGRGRGDFGARSSLLQAGSGAFGAPSPLLASRGPFAAPFGGGPGASSRPFGASGAGSANSAYQTTTGNPDGERRMNADTLYMPLPDNFDEEDTDTSRRRKKDLVVPVGMYKEEHKDREVIVATSAELEAEEAGGDESMWIGQSPSDQLRDSEMTNDIGVWPGAPERPEGNIKTEEGELMSIAAIADRKHSSTEGLAGSEGHPRAEEETAAKPRKRKIAAEDPEEALRAENLVFNLSWLSLGADEDSKFSEEELRKQQEDRLFLVQFPPVMPPLDLVPQGVVKDEPEDVIMLDKIPKGILKNPVDLTSEDKATRKKKDTDGEEAERAEPRNPATDPVSTVPGHIGRLDIHKSGRTELVFGNGLVLDMQPGIHPTFYTSAMLIVEEEDRKPKRNDEPVGVAYNMGQVHHTFILTPNWSEEEDWVVDPADLVVEDLL